MLILNDLTNTFGFFGQGGSGPGNHTLNEVVSSKNFGKIANILNKISWLTAYSEESTEKHISTFYGSVLFRDVDSTLTALLDQTYTTYGIPLEFDNQNANTVNVIFNSTTNTFDIPVQDDLLIDDMPPYFRVEALYIQSSLYPFRASAIGFENYCVKVALFDCESGVQFTNTDYLALNDYDLKLFVFGYKPVNVAVI